MVKFEKSAATALSEMYGSLLARYSICKDNPTFFGIGFLNGSMGIQQRDLERLEKLGLIETVVDDKAGNGYRITDKGSNITRETKEYQEKIHAILRN